MLGIGPILWNSLRATPGTWLGLRNKPAPNARWVCLRGSMSTRYYKAIDSLSRGDRRCDVPVGDFIDYNLRSRPFP